MRLKPSSSTRRTRTATWWKRTAISQLALLLIRQAERRVSHPPSAQCDAWQTTRYRRCWSDSSSCFKTPASTVGQQTTQLIIPMIWEKPPSTHLCLLQQQCEKAMAGLTTAETLWSSWPKAPQLPGMSSTKLLILSTNLLPKVARSRRWCSRSRFRLTHFSSISC